MMASVHLIQPVSICRIWYVSTCSLLPRSGVVMVCDYILDSRTSLFTSLQDSCDTPRALRCFFTSSHTCSSRWCLALFLYSSTFLLHVCLTRNHPSFAPGSMASLESPLTKYRNSREDESLIFVHSWSLTYLCPEILIPLSSLLHLDNTQSFQTKPFFVNLYCSCGFTREAKWAVCDFHCSQTRASPSWKHAFSIQHIFVFHLFEDFQTKLRSLRQWKTILLWLDVWIPGCITRAGPLVRWLFHRRICAIPAACQRRTADWQLQTQWIFQLHRYSSRPFHTIQTWQFVDVPNCNKNGFSSGRASVQSTAWEIIMDFWSNPLRSSACNMRAFASLPHISATLFLFFFVFFLGRRSHRNHARVFSDMAFFFFKRTHRWFLGDDWATDWCGCVHFQGMSMELPFARVHPQAWQSPNTRCTGLCDRIHFCQMW